jgi:hypothetical protein
MARAHTVAYSSAHCTVRLHYECKRDAVRAVRECYDSKWHTLLGVIATYEGKQIVRGRSVRRRRALRAPLTLERVPLIDLFFIDFPGHHAARRTT